MTHLPKLILHPNTRWVSFKMSLKILRLQNSPICNHSFLCHNACSCCRLFGSLAHNAENKGESVVRVSLAVKKQVESVLLDYLYSTRNMLYSDADYMVKNSPHFMRKLVDKVRHEPDVRRSMARYLNCHPINEFEPFFESIGLEPSEIAPLLPRHLMYLSDDDRLIDNFRVLCEYGVDRAKIGKIYREAREVFGYDKGVLKSKLLAFEKARMRPCVVARVVSFNPKVLVSDVSTDFFEFIRNLKCLGCESSWFEEWLVETTTYKWRRVTQLLHLLDKLGCNNGDVMKLVGRRPGLLFDHSGRPTLLLIGFLLKFGVTKTDICSFILRFPQVKVENFVCNLKRVFELLSEIEMDAMIMGRIIREHFTWMGTCSLKKPGTILRDLKTGKKHFCQIIMANPMKLKTWTLGTKLNCLPETRDVRSRRDKIKFLTSIGFTENTKEIEKALKAFRGKVEELPERFDFLVKSGLNENDVARMIKMVPQILNQSIEALEAKISVLVNDLGYPLSTLKLFPLFMSYSMERAKLRCAMYNWLIDQKVVPSKLSLRKIIECTESVFIRKYVNKHPRGPEVWGDYKQTFSSL